MFALIYSLISIVNHYQFRTYSLDLGVFNNALYSYAHFKSNYLIPTSNVSGTNFLGDHFSPITFLYAPFYYLFGSYSLLIIQIASVLFGGAGIYSYCKLKFPAGYIPLIITFQFFGIWGIYSALSFDFHNNVVGAMLVPWLVYFHEKNKKNLFLIFFVLILISKENMALWLAFIMLGLVLKRGAKNFKSVLAFEFPLIAFSLIYFVLVVSIIMPWLQNLNSNSQLYRYSSLGNSLPEIINSMIRHPGSVFRMLFENTLNNEKYSGIKTEMHLMVLASGGLLLFYRPYYLIMLLPIYAQKLFTNDFILWGINAQYSIEFAPILSLALADSVASFNSTKTRYYVCILYTISTHFFNINSIDHRKSQGYNSGNTRYYSPDHYNPYLDLPSIYMGLKLIPDDAALSASNTLVPHLANRDEIYTFPIIKDAEYIAVLDTSTNISTYPASKKAYAAKIDSCKKSGAFSTVYDKGQLLILKKK